MRFAGFHRRSPSDRIQIKALETNAEAPDRNSFRRDGTCMTRSLRRERSDPIDSSHVTRRRRGIYDNSTQRSSDMRIQIPLFHPSLCSFIRARVQKKPVEPKADCIKTPNAFNRCLKALIRAES